MSITAKLRPSFTLGERKSINDNVKSGHKLITFVIVYMHFVIFNELWGTP